MKKIIKGNIVLFALQIVSFVLVELLYINRGGVSLDELVVSTIIIQVGMNVLVLAVHLFNKYDPLEWIFKD